MGHVNYWLVGSAFLLGLLLTFALTVRRVKREVPVSSSAGADGAPATGPSEAPVADADATEEDSSS